MEYRSPVSISTHGRVMVITIDRPTTRNAVNGDVARGIADAVDELECNEHFRVGVLTGAGGTFCSGMDLKAFLAGDLPWVAGRGFGGLTQTPPSKPLIAAVEGWAVAGGFELMLACDIVIAAETAQFGVPEVKRGIVAGGGAALRLTQRIPRAIALEMLLTGNLITAGRAAELGLVNHVTRVDEALTVALELADSVAANGPLAVAVTKQIALSAPSWSPQDEWSEQDRLVKPVYQSTDAREGAAAFAEKRAARWSDG